MTVIVKFFALMHEVGSIQIGVKFICYSFGQTMVTIFAGLPHAFRHVGSLS